MKKPGRVAIVYPSSNLDSVPSLCNTAVLLAEHGYWVDIFTCLDDIHVRPTFTDERISVLPAYAASLNGQPSPWRLFRDRVCWLLRLLVRHQRKPYVCIIGVDPLGLVRARIIARWVKAPLAYYSLELLLSYELVTEYEQQLKVQERALSQEAAFVIIQDEERAALLARDNQLSPARIICVPNAPLGSASRHRSNYLREKFDISLDTKIILHTGSVGAWACTHQLMRSTHDWPDDWVLVCHTRYRAIGLDRDYITTLQDLAKPGRVFFSTEPISHHEYPQLVQSADVGVAFYCIQPGSTWTQDNILHIGLSSGKLAYYLCAGLPVLVNDVPSLRRLVSTYHCGEATVDPAATSAAIECILADYETYSQNAVTCFNREFDFVGKFNQVFIALERLKQRQPHVLSNPW